jgi:hypothetical protein
MRIFFVGVEQLYTEGSRINFGLNEFLPRKRRFDAMCGACESFRPPYGLVPSHCGR